MDSYTAKPSVLLSELEILPPGSESTWEEASIMNCELQPDKSTPNDSVSTPLLTTDGSPSLDNGHLMSPTYILCLHLKNYLSCP